MRDKYYSQYLLRALEGEDLRLDAELAGLVELGERAKRAMPPAPALDDDARRRIWKGVVSTGREPAARHRGETNVPRLAWVAAAAVLAIAVILVVVFVYIGGPEPRDAREIASLRLEGGEITVRDTQGVERSAGDGEAVYEGEVILAAADSRGILEFVSGNIVRMNGEAEVAAGMPGDGIEVEVFKGRTYHRILDGTPYTARADDVTITAHGTAFTLDVEDETTRVISVHSRVGVSVDYEGRDDWSSTLEEGDVFVYGKEKEARILELMLELIDNEWLRWNKARDELLGLPVGILLLLEETESGEPEPEPGQPAQPENPPADGVEPDRPEAQPQPSPQPDPSQPTETSLALTASARQGAVDFGWTVTGYSGFQGYKLCRSESNTSPSYPGDWWMYIDGENTRSASDTTVQAGRTYYYRLAVYNQGAVLGYSNAVKVTVPGTPQELSISLSAAAEGGKVKLSWSVGGGGDYSGFKVCRSETNPNPTYPGEWNVLVDASARSYVDADVISGRAYYYRVGIYKDGSIVKYSNSVKVTVP